MKLTAKLLAAVVMCLVSMPAMAASVGARQVRQQQRIAQGVQSGELTAGEAAKLERKEARVHRQIRRDKRDGGQFTKAERVKAQAKLDRTSAQIYLQKHDAQRR